MNVKCICQYHLELLDGKCKENFIFFVLLSSVLTFIPIEVHVRVFMTRDDVNVSYILTLSSMTDANGCMWGHWKIWSLAKIFYKYSRKE